MRNVVAVSLPFLCLGLLSGGLPSRALAYSTGITSSQFVVDGCNTCHNGGRTPEVELDGPAELAPGAQGTYTFVVHEVGEQDKAGLNVSAPKGVLGAAGNLVRATTNTKTKLIEITHIAPTAMDLEGKTTFSFTFTAPDAFTSVVLTAWGNAVNGKDGFNGDWSNSATLTVRASGCVDEDGDGYNDTACGGDDCDDADTAVYPGGVELCNGEDDNCDGESDSGGATYYSDQDGDGHGDPAASQTLCGDQEGYVQVGDDCDDADSSRYPGAVELCDGKDNNCNGQAEEEELAGVEEEPDDGVDNDCDGEIDEGGSSSPTPEATPSEGDDDDLADDGCGGCDQAGAGAGLGQGLLIPLAGALLWYVRRRRIP